MTKCPYCNGTGKCNPVMKALPPNYIPLVQLAAMAGYDIRTVYHHRAEGLLATTLWTGLYTKNGSRAVNTINVVTRTEAERYLAWVADRRTRKGGGGSLNLKLDKIEKALAEGEDFWELCSEHGCEPRNLRSSLRRRQRLGQAQHDLTDILASTVSKQRACAGFKPRRLIGRAA